eukprot:1498712-Pleurochrysis_carterae.AAC.1
MQPPAPRRGAWLPRSPLPPASTPPIRASAEGGGGWGEQCARSHARWLRHRARSIAKVRCNVPPSSLYVGTYVLP